MGLAFDIGPTGNGALRFRRANIASQWGVRWAMPFEWLKQLGRTLAATAPPTGDRPSFDITKHAIGFCPGCKRLRGVASPRCHSCGSLAMVTADA